MYLVGGYNLPLGKMMELKPVGMMKFPIYGNIMKNKQCSKPPTRLSFNDHYQWPYDNLVVVLLVLLGQGLINHHTSKVFWQYDSIHQ
jgi:hypothetical protein